MAMMSYRGSCHCEAIGYAYHTEQDPSTWNVRACQCTFCRAHGARTTSDPDASIEFTARNIARLTRYRFGQGTTDFLICSECGVYIGAQLETPRGSFGIINVNALQPIPSGLTQAVAMEYGSETKELRIGRREQRWSRASGP
jgi:hypothetical protein